MKSAKDFRLYAGDGTTAAERDVQLPPYEPFGRLDDPRLYRASQGLRNAVNVALALGQPLLLTGHPGTGKTQLAGSVAYELGLAPPLVFNAKTTSVARDLFYQYDALRHFHASQFHKDETDVKDYISFEALGLAILLTQPPDDADPYLPAKRRGSGPVRSVVLIDEIDKAPRDLPNDVLNEIENMSFTVPELRKTFRASGEMRPISIMTSNSEKDLPDAFLRRCVFFHIDLPDKDELARIVKERVGLSPDFSGSMLDAAIARFQSIQEMRLKHRPATAEFLAWVRILDDMKVDLANVKPEQREILAFSYSVIAKTEADLTTLRGTAQG